MKTIAFALFVGGVMWALQAFALPFAHLIARRWVWLYTRCLPQEIQELRASDAQAHHQEFEQDMFRRSYKPEQVALHLLVNILIGVRDDLGWRWDTSTLRFRRSDDMDLRMLIWLNSVATLRLILEMYFARHTSDAKVNVLYVTQIAMSILISMLLWQQRRQAMKSGWPN